jgi:hypothetical protein
LMFKHRTTPKGPTAITEPQKGRHTG